MLGINITDQELTGLQQSRLNILSRPLVLQENQTVKQAGEGEDKEFFISENGKLSRLSPPMMPGAEYYVKESFCNIDDDFYYKIDGNEPIPVIWENRARMPQRAARYTLTIISARLDEVLHDAFEWVYQVQLNDKP